MPSRPRTLSGSQQPGISVSDRAASGAALCFVCRSLSGCSAGCAGDNLAGAYAEDLAHVDPGGLSAGFLKVLLAPARKFVVFIRPVMRL